MQILRVSSRPRPGPWGGPAGPLLERYRVVQVVGLRPDQDLHLHVRRPGEARVVSDVHAWLAHALD